MTVEREQEPSNSAFVSYRSPYRRVAERLQRSLYRIADRHEEQTGEFRVFLDSSALKPGPLRENVYSALRRSHHLVVLLDAHTATSDWVSDEITHWLGNGGRADRLFLVRVDPDADLGWDGERFTNTAAVPAPLRELFREEPKWIDFRPRRLLGPDQAGLAGLCGALMDADVEQFGLVEAANQRDQVRTRTRLAGVMAVLLVLAVVAAIFAYVNQQRAQANTDQAQAQADSAEALPAAQGSPTLAIERALQAAARSDSPTVRSALLAVSQAAGRLVHAVVYPEADTGHPTAAAHFSGDGGTLLAWGADREPGTSRGTWLGRDLRRGDDERDGAGCRSPRGRAGREPGAGRVRRLGAGADRPDRGVDHHPPRSTAAGPLDPRRPAWCASSRTGWSCW